MTNGLGSLIVFLGVIRAALELLLAYHRYQRARINLDKE